MVVCYPGYPSPAKHDILLQVKQSLKLLMGSVHVSVTAACQEYFERYRRHVYVTPKSYLSFLAGYR